MMSELAQSACSHPLCRKSSEPISFNPCPCAEVWRGAQADAALADADVQTARSPFVLWAAFIGAFVGDGEGTQFKNSCRTK